MESHQPYSPTRLSSRKKLSAEEGRAISQTRPLVMVTLKVRCTGKSNAEEEGEDMRAPGGRPRGRPQYLAAGLPPLPTTRLGSAAPKVLEGGLRNRGRRETAVSAGRPVFTDHHREDICADCMCPGLWVTRGHPGAREWRGNRHVCKPLKLLVHYPFIPSTNTYRTSSSYVV